MVNMGRAAAQVALAGIFCTLGCTTPSAPTPARAEPAAPSPAAAVLASTASVESATSRQGSSNLAPPPLDPRVEVPETAGVVTLQPVSEPRYAPPESLKKFRFPQKNQPDATLAKATSKRPATPPGAMPVNTTAAPAGTASAAIEVSAPTVVAVNAEAEAPRYKAPDSLKEWGSGRKVPLYADPEAEQWQAAPTEPRLRNAAVSCNYKDEGGVRGKVMLLIDDFTLTRFNARIEMPNGGICQFDGKNMEQRPFEQGIALASKGDECVVRMWEQKHRITIAAYSCHKQCSKGSFSYLWPILMDTRIGTCY